MSYAKQVVLMSTKVLYPPLAYYFFNNLFSSTDEVVLVAPYIKFGIASKIIDTLSAANSINNIKLTLVTNISTANFINGSSDSEAIEILLERVPNMTVIGIGNLHAKSYLFDARVSIITSGNLTPSGMYDNLEIGIQIVDDVTTRKMRNMLLSHYGEKGKKIAIQDIRKIRAAINKYYLENTDVIKQLDRDTEHFNSTIEKFTSPRIKIENHEIVASSITSIISTRGPRKTTYKPFQQDSPLPQPHFSFIKAKAPTKVVVPNVEKEWLDMYSVLLAFRKTNPKYWPLKSDTFDELGIGLWCFTQREEFENNKLAKEKIALLRKIKFELDNKNEFWEHRYNLLCDYRQEFPNQWPNTKEMYHGIQIGVWCKAARKSKNKGTLDTGRIKKLEDIGFIWDDLEAYWGQSISLLREFREQHPDRWPHTKELFKGYDLYLWCRALVKERSRRERLTPEKIHDLAEIGFPFDSFISNEKARVWHMMYLLLERYIKENRHVPSGDVVYQGHHLGKWTDKQRRGMAADRKSYSDNEKMLASLGVKPLFPRPPSKTIRISKPTGKRSVEARPISPLRDKSVGSLDET
jgi:hypothetical protein